MVRRELPDGTVQFPPAMKGMITYTKEFRNFSVVSKDEHLIVDGQIGDKGISYDLSNTTAKSPVSIDGGTHPVCAAPALRAGALHHRGI